MSKEEIYAKLAEAFRWDPNKIASLTPHQQIACYDPKSVSRVIHFNTHEEYLEWSRRRSVDAMHQQDELE